MDATTLRTDSSGPVIDVGGPVNGAVALATGSSSLVIGDTIPVVLVIGDTLQQRSRSHHSCCWFRQSDLQNFNTNDFGS